MRMYQPIWEKIKEDGNSGQIAIHPAKLARVIKAVCKEKHMDVKYNFDIALAGEVATLSHEIVQEKPAMIIVFKLTRGPRLGRSRLIF